MCTTLYLVPLVERHGAVAFLEELTIQLPRCVDVVSPLGVAKTVIRAPNYTEAVWIAAVKILELLPGERSRGGGVVDHHTHVMRNSSGWGFSCRNARSSSRRKDRHAGHVAWSE